MNDPAKDFDGPPDDDVDEEPLGAGIDFSDPNSPLAPYYLQASHVVAAVGLVAMAFVLSIVPLWHTDFWAHLAYGRWIVEHQELPAREPLSPFTDPEQPMAHFQWLTQVIYHGLFQFGQALAGGDEIRQMEGGVGMLRTLTLVQGVIYGWVLLLAFLRASNSMPAAAAGLLAVFLVGWTPTIIRPQVSGQLCFAILLWALSGPTRSRRLIWGLPLLFVLWVNLHGSFPIGFYLVGLVWIGTAITAAKEGNGPAWRAIWTSPDVRRLTIATSLAIVAAGFLNPHGPSIFLKVVHFGQHPNIASFIEWQSLANTPGDSKFWNYFVSVALILLTAWLGWHAGPVPIVVLIGFLLIPWVQARLYAWWAPVSIWVLMPSWGRYKPRDLSTPSFIKTIMVGLLVFSVLAFTPPVRWLLRHGPTPANHAVQRDTPWIVAFQLEQPSSSLLPPLAKALQTNYGGQYRGAIYTPETLGDFFVWRTPQFPVFAFSHGHLFTARHWNELMSVETLDKGWRDVLDKHRINLVVAERTFHEGLLRQLQRDADWEVVHTGEDPALPLIVALRKVPLVASAK